jgi:hypothetical protein
MFIAALFTIAKLQNILVIRGIERWSLSLCFLADEISSLLPHVL